MLKRVIRKTAEKYRSAGFFATVKWFYVSAKIKLRIMKCPTGDYYRIRPSRNAEGSILLKPMPSIFICAGVPYYDIGGGQRSSQLAKVFNSMGYAVHYFYAYPSCESEYQRIPLPLCAHHIMRGDLPERIRGRITPDDIFIFETPSGVFAPLLSLAKECRCKIIYESIDNWETSLGNGILDRSMLLDLLSCAHLITATAKPLAKQAAKYLHDFGFSDKEVLYLPNAVDTSLFCPREKYAMPGDMKRGRITLLYFGSLWGEWFDWKLLFDLADRHPEYCINLIGDCSRIPDKVSSAPYNIRFLGLKPHRLLPAYLAHTDYALIPFKPGAISDYVSPLKVFEYIAMEKRVLSTDLPDIEGYPNVYVGNTAKAWEKHIEKNAKLLCPKDFINKNSWYHRGSALLSRVTLQTTSLLRDKLSVVILNRNNKDIILHSIDALVSFMGDMNYEIIVVDNCSTDGSYEALSALDGKIKLLRNSKNGCSSARNLGVSHAEGDYILFLDSDQWPVCEEWLRPYEAVMAMRPDFGLIGWAAGFFDKNGRAHHVTDSFPHRYMPPNALARTDVGYLGSGGMLVKKDVFLSVGGFDVNYDPTCYEDTDLSLKIRDSGREIYYCPYAGIYHLPHQTTKSGSESHRLMTELKGEYFTRKWKNKNPDLLKYIK